MIKKDSVTLLSHTIGSNTPGYGGSSPFSRKKVKSLCSGDSCNQEEWTINNHTGTHIDSPKHFIKDGDSITDIGIESFVFSKVELISLETLNAGHMVTPSDIKNKIKNKDLDLLLIKTGFEKFRSQEIYWKNNPGFTPELAGWLKQNCPNIQAIGFDSISLTSFSNREVGRLAHREFLSSTPFNKSILIIEDMKLSDMKKSPNAVIVSPLMVEKADGSPVTVWAL